MAAAHNATVVYYGTAWNETNLLAQAIARHRELERRDGERRHFEADWRAVAACTSTSALLPSSPASASFDASLG